MLSWSIRLAPRGKARDTRLHGAMICKVGGPARLVFAEMGPRKTRLRRRGMKPKRAALGVGLLRGVSRLSGGGGHSPLPIYRP
jgi:hypothetical protein